MEWIDVNDELPEEGEHVLTYIKDGFYAVDYLIISPVPPAPYVWGCQLYDEWEVVTHWMPLPFPPSANNDEEVFEIVDNPLVVYHPD